MSKGDTVRLEDSSPDDGELSDHSGHDNRQAKREFKTSDISIKRPRSSSQSVSPSPQASSKDKPKSTNASDEEDRLRRRLLEKREVGASKHRHHSGDEEEMFTIQPGDGKSRSSDRDRGDRFARDRVDRDRVPERDRQPPKHKHEVSDRQDRDRRERDERGHRIKHDRSDRGDRLAGRLTLASSTRDVRSERDRVGDRMDRSGRSDRNKEKERDQRERRSDRGEERRGKHERDIRKKHKRSRSRSSSADEKNKKRDRRTSDRDKKREKRDVNSKDRAPLDDSHSEGENVPAPVSAISSERAEAMEVTEVVEEDKTPVHTGDTDEEAAGSNERLVPPEDEITAFTLDSPAGPKKYSKFESSPEMEDYDRTPVRSDVESDDDVEVMDFDPETARFEDLTEEQKLMLTPDTKKSLEDAWQKRLIAQLPVFYPGIMGCRSVNEFSCENKIEEGTYGVVFRARDRRTDEVVALKRLKMEKEKEGFPITSLREINMLLKAGNHNNIVNVQEVLIGSTMDKIFVVMEFVEHDMKNLMDIMSKRGKRFSIGEQKTLMIQLLSGLKHMHDLWILHRDLKTSNLLLSHKGVLKIADFGLAREFGSPLKAYTPIVVTLWYRAPELLLGEKMYSTAIDMWSVGCIMAEFLLLKPLFPGRGDTDQINKIFLELGTPNEKIWPGYEELPALKQYPYNQLRKKFPASLLNETGWKLMNELLRYDPDKRLKAANALHHPWFTEEPRPTPPEMFPTFPAKSEQHKAPPPSKRPAAQSDVILNAGQAKLYAGLNVHPDQVKSGGFALKFDKNPF